MKTIKKEYRVFISFILMLFFIITLSTSRVLPFSIIANAAESPYITSGNLYYIKNVNSGKYITLPNANTSVGTKLVQESFSQTGKQKWYVTYQSTGIHAGFYKITSYLNTNRALAIETPDTGTGQYLIIKSAGSDINQNFNLTAKNNTSHIMYTNISNCAWALMVKASSLSANANIIQRPYYSTAPAYEWLFEPVSGYNVTNALSYALSNKNTSLPTYPDITNLNAQSYPQYDYFDESINYVSQCLSSGGQRGNASGFVNRLNSTYPSPTNPSQLASSWSYDVNGCTWLNSRAFYNYWQSLKPVNYYGAFNIKYNVGTSSTISYNVGDVVLIRCPVLYTVEPDNSETWFAGIITSVPNSSDKGSYIITFHDNKYTKDEYFGGSISVREITEFFLQESDQIKVYFMKFSSY